MRATGQMFPGSEALWGSGHRGGGEWAKVEQDGEGVKRSPDCGLPWREKFRSFTEKSREHPRNAEALSPGGELGPGGAAMTGDRPFSPGCCLQGDRTTPALGWGEEALIPSPHS